MKNRAVATAATHYLAVWIQNHVRVFGFVPSTQAREIMAIYVKRFI